MQRRVLTGSLATLTLVVSLPAIAQTALDDLMAKTWSVWAWTTRLTAGLMGGRAASTSAWPLRALH